MPQDPEEEGVKCQSLKFTLAMQDLTHRFGAVWAPYQKTQAQSQGAMPNLAFELFKAYQTWELDHLPQQQPSSQPCTTLKRRREDSAPIDTESPSNSEDTIEVIMLSDSTSHCRLYGSRLPHTSILCSLTHELTIPTYTRSDGSFAAGYHGFWLSIVFRGNRN